MYLQNVDFQLLVFKDENTPSPFEEDLISIGGDTDSLNAALPDHVYMDAMAFGMGCCCLQMTFQVRDNIKTVGRVNEVLA